LGAAFKKKTGDFAPPPLLSAQDVFGPAEQSAKAESQLPQILPLYKANITIRPIDNTKLTGVVYHLTHLLSKKGSEISRIYFNDRRKTLLSFRNLKKQKSKAKTTLAPIP
jgi:hypothetical protein